MGKTRNMLERLSISLGKGNGDLIVYPGAILDMATVTVRREPVEDVRRVLLLSPPSTNKLIHGPFCGGEFKVHKVTSPRAALFCSGCGLRLLFPSRINTVGELEKYYR